MTARLLLASALLASVALAQTAQAPSPRDLYHAGAGLFVDGDNAAALAAVESGLAQAPGDARLEALRDLILQNQDDNDQQDQNQDSQGEQDQRSQGGEPDESTEDPGSEPDDRSPETEQDGTAQQPPPPSGSGQSPPQQAGEPAEMTPAQADRLLDAVGGEERLLLREMRRAPTQRRRGDKDW